MRYAIRTHATRISLSASLPAALAVNGSALLRTAWQHLAEAVARWRLEPRQRGELELLDASALRDLGLHRSEYRSYLAESSGTAESTRRRLAASS